MDEDNASPKLDLNQTVVANDNDDEATGDLQDEDASAETARASENSPFQAAGNGSSPKLASPVRDEYVLSNQEAVPSPSPARGTPSPQPKQSTKSSRSPSPKKRLSSPAARRSSSRDPEERRRHSRSPDSRHGRRRDDGRRRHDRSHSPLQRMNHRERSRSRSPHDRERDRYRYSPRRRSSPPRYSSRGMRSPRKRPWSPPRNRNTGLGKPGNHLFVAGFSFATTERDLEKKFGRYGRVSDVRIIRDRRSGDSRGFGFLSLERDEDADAAIEGLDQTEWNGRIVLVEKAKTT